MIEMIIKGNLCCFLDHSPYLLLCPCGLCMLELMCVLALLAFQNFGFEMQFPLVLK
uniref:Uncharacterized protein n=1 Tax=Arundo donax TaxID=35708 RepID=A0A0A9EZB3_ARUDO